MEECKVSRILITHFKEIIHYMITIMYKFYLNDGNIKYNLFYYIPRGTIGARETTKGEEDIPESSIYLFTVSAPDINIWDVWDKPIPNINTVDYFEVKKKCVDVLWNHYRKRQVYMDFKEIIKNARLKEASK